MSKTVYVRRSVWAASQRLEQLSNFGQDCDSSNLAEQKIRDCQNAGDRSGQEFWRAVWLHLITTRGVEAQINIVDDDGQSHRQIAG